MTPITKRVKNAVLALFLLGIFPTSTFSANCGSCAGCISFMPLLRATAVEIEQEFYHIERGIANKYSSEILPLMEDNKLLEEKITVAQGQLEIMERRMLAINKEIALILSLTKKVRTLNDDNTQSYLKDRK